MPGLHRGQGAYGEFTRGSQRIAWDVFAFSCALVCGRLVASTPRFSRKGFTSPFGKLSKPINGLTLPADIDEKLRARATHAGLPFLELLREVIVIAEAGRDAVEDAHRRRLDAIEGKSDA